MDPKETLRRLINKRAAEPVKPKHDPYADLREVYRSSISRDPVVRFHGKAKA